MTVTVKQIRTLREKTHAGMMYCKAALTKANGDIAKAVDELRKAGVIKGNEQSNRKASEGLIHSYIHMGRIGVMLEVNCETDFAAKSDMFMSLVNDIALHIAAANPLYLCKKDINENEIDNERCLLIDMAEKSGKPDHIIGKIVEGQMKKYVKQICLLSQPFVKDSSKTINELCAEVSGLIGEAIVIKRFTRYVLGAEE